MLARLLPGVLIFLAPLFSGESGVRACQETQDKKEPPENVKVTMVVILASEKGNHVDKRLKWIAAEIQKRNPQLKSFQLKTMTYKSLAPKVETEFALVDDKKATVVVTQSADPKNRVGLSVTPPNQGKIVYRSVCGKFLPIVTRYRTKDDQRLILAIRVQPCLGD